MRLGVLLIVLAGCGRIGFNGPGGGDDTISPDADPDGPGDGLPVTVTVTGTVGEPGAGDPVVGGFVVFVGPGGSEVVQTDEDGNATGTITDVTEIHIAYEVGAGGPSVIAPGWRVASFYEVAGVTSLVVGAPDPFDDLAPITVTLPDVGSTKYRVEGPIRCGLHGENTTPSIAAAFLSRCAGEAVPVFAHADDAWLDPGALTLIPEATTPLAGTWAPTMAHRVRFTGLPAGTDYAAALLAVTVSPGSVLSLGEAEAVPAGGVSDLLFMGPPLTPDRQILYVALDDKLAGQVQFAAPPAPVGGVRTVASSSLPRRIDQVQFDLPSRTTVWTYGPATQVEDVIVASVVGFETSNAVWVDWSSYRRSSATTQTLPVLPPPLDVLVPSSTTDYEAAVTLTSVPGKTYQEALARVDRDFNFFLGEAVFLDAERDFALSFRILPPQGKSARLAPRGAHVLPGWRTRAASR